MLLTGLPTSRAANARLNSRGQAITICMLHVCLRSPAIPHPKSTMNPSSPTALPYRASTSSLELTLSRLLAQAWQRKRCTAHLYDKLHATVDVNPPWIRITLSQKAKPVSEKEFLAVVNSWPHRPMIMTTPRLVYDQARDMHLVITEYPTPMAAEIGA